MPNSDFTAKLLELEDVMIENFYSTDTENHIFISLKRRPHHCPHCQTLTDKVHDYRVSIAKDLPFMGKRTLLHYNKRRYHCPTCGKHFYESFPLLPKHYRITTRLAYYSLHLLAQRQSVSWVAALLGISCSSVFRHFQMVSYSKPSRLPSVLSIDEFRGNAGGNKFQVILTDPRKRKIVDILPNRKQTELMQYFQGFPDRTNVQYVVMDMCQSYRTIAKQYFPNASIVVDKFHVVRYVTWAVEKVRKRIQEELHPSRRKYFKRSRRLLLTRRDKLKPEAVDALEVMLRLSPDLATAYYLKEIFFEFSASKNRAEATQKLQHFILAAEAANLPEFETCLTMLHNWSSYILNAYDCHYTNGYTEGTNNTIKVIKRNAFGYRNFNNFRNRILLSMT